MALNHPAGLFRLACEAVQRLPADASAAVTVACPAHGLSLDAGQTLALSRWLAAEYGLQHSFRLEDGGLTIRFSRPNQSARPSAIR